jgi:3-hydroxyisobutyrate dehydrogenase-like beta-hydroxyacid dehydrogenase
MKSLLPEQHPEQAFPVTYMLKDVRYAMALAEAAGLALQGAGTTIRLLEETAQLGFAEAYYTAVLEAVRRHRIGPTGQ